MTRINSNIPALRATTQLSRNFSDLNTRLERLSTGLRINRGRDDPAGLIASERLRFEIRAIGQAVDNSTRALNVISTAEAALNESNSLLLDLQSLVVEAANEGALTQEEVSANQLQIDSILASLDRIANTTRFASRKLLDGSQAYILSSVATSALASVTVFSARLPESGPRTVTVSVTQSAQTGQIAFIGSNPGGTSTTSATSIELQGTTGTELISFAAGATFTEIAAAVNSITNATGVSAVVSTTATGTTTSAILLNSVSVGSDQFVSVTPITGNFVTTGNNNSVIRDVGQDAGVLIDGQAALVRGLRADVRTGNIDARIYVTKAQGQTISSQTFSITGGGSLFQLTPEVSSNGQVNVAFNSLRSTQLGNSVVGRLHTLRSGAANDLNTKNFLSMQKIVAEAIDQVSTSRGRLGNLAKNTIDTNISAQNIALENVTAAESVIRDADMAAELSALTRAQILVQSTQSSLQIANSVPNLVLSLLG